MSLATAGDPLTWGEAFNPTPFHTAMEVHGGYAGSGIDWAAMLSLWPALMYAVGFFVVRHVGQGYIFPLLAQLLGIPKKHVKRSRKFGYQVWLFAFYSTSSYVGYKFLEDAPWVSFPLGDREKAALLEHHPSQPSDAILLYYTYEIGFFLSELFAIFIEDRRADFMEYLVHHVTTIYLLVFSHMGYEHRIGTYVLIIHDLSDIFLCVAKMLHYLKWEPWVTINFVCFVIIFFYMRLICFPSLSSAIALCGPMVRPPTANFWCLAFMLSIVLQGLHIYWFVLILRMIIRMMMGSLGGDIRSDSDEDDDAAAADKKKKTEGDSKMTKKKN